MEQHNRRMTDTKASKRSSMPLLVFSWGTIALAFGFLITLAVWLWYPYDVVSINNVHMDTKTVVQGQRAVYSFDLNKKISAVGVISRHYVDGIIFDAGQTPADAPVGNNRVITQVIVPSTLPPGKYRLQLVFRYPVNPIRTVEYIFYSDEFTVQSPAHPDAEQDALQDSK